jgi:hypothetical protein
MVVGNMRHITSFLHGNYGCCHQTRNIMPQLIKHIDAIARHKQREILFLQTPLERVLEIHRNTMVACMAEYVASDSQ